MIALLVFSIFTNFNLSGYAYHLDENTNMFSLEEGFVKKKEIYSEHVNEYNSINIAMVMLDINHAKELWYASILIFLVFTAALFGLLDSRLKSKKHVKWIIALYITSFTIFIIWNINSHKEILEEIAQNINFFKT